MDPTRRRPGLCEALDKKEQMRIPAMSFLSQSDGALGFDGWKQRLESFSFPFPKNKMRTMGRILLIA